MIPTLRSSRPARRGSGAIEFAVTLPFLLLLLLGIIELSLLMHRNYIVTRSARDACRIGSGVLEGPLPTGDVIEAAALDHAELALGMVGLDCHAVGCDLLADWHEEDGWMLLTVTVGVPYQPLTQLFPLVPPMTRRQFTMFTQQQLPEP